MVLPSSFGQHGGHVVVGDQLGAGEPVRLPGVRGGGGGDLGGHGCDVAGVDQAGAALAGRGAEAARLGDRRGQRQDVLHVGVRPQQRVRDSGGSQPRLDLGLPAPPRDRRVRRGLAGRLDDMARRRPGPRCATTFSSWAGTAGLTSTTALTPAIASSMLAGTSRSPSATSAPASASAVTLRRVPHQHPDGHIPLAQQADRLGADLPGRCHEDHGESLRSLAMGCTTPFWRSQTGLSNPESWYRGGVAERGT